MKSHSITSIIFLCFVQWGFAQSLERVEPPFWWTGMKNTSLQLMLYGHNLQSLQFEIDYEGVFLDRVIGVENENYVFLDLEISSNAKPGVFDIIIKKENQKIITYPYNLMERKLGSSGRQGFNNSDVIYLITPDRFANGDPSNDNAEGYSDKMNRSAPYGRHGGDLKGIINHLDYIEGMGFTAIWLNPVQENAMERASYHGYAITDFYKIDPRLGSNSDYVDLVEESKRRGIKVIMDMVANHCGSFHWWMNDLPSRDWINYQEQYRITNHRKSTSLDPYVSKTDRKLMQDGWFVPSMPDLNQRNPLMANYIIQNSIWWIEYAQISGIRQDTYSYPDEDFISDWSCAIMHEYPNFNIVGEEWSENPLQVAYWQKGQTWSNSCLPSLMDFPINKTLIEALTSEEGWSKGLASLYEMLGNDFIYADPNQLMVFADNHDMSRIFTTLGEDPDLFKMAMIYISTIRGIPQIFYGTEILMSNKGTESHGVIRSDMPGGWSGDRINAFTQEGLSLEQIEAQNFMKKLLNWRKTNLEVQYGELLHYIPEHGTYVYFRKLIDKGVMVIINKSGDEIEFSRFHEGVKGAVKGTELFSGQDIIFGEIMKLEPKTAYIIEYKIPVSWD